MRVTTTKHPINLFFASGATLLRKDRSVPAGTQLTLMCYGDTKIYDHRGHEVAMVTEGPHRGKWIILSELQSPPLHLAQTKGMGETPPQADMDSGSDTFHFLVAPPKDGDEYIPMRLSFARGTIVLATGELPGTEEAEAGVELIRVFGDVLMRNAISFQLWNRKESDVSDEPAEDDREPDKIQIFCRTRG